jgi:hypothetical protein
VAQIGWAKDLHVAQVGRQQSLQSPGLAEGPGQPKGHQTKPPNQEIYRGRDCIPKSNLEVTRKFIQEKEPPYLDGNQLGAFFYLLGFVPCNCPELEKGTAYVFSSCFANIQVHISK